MPMVPGFVRVSHFRFERDKYTFNVSYRGFTLRNAYLRIESGEFGFPAQAPGCVDPHTCQVISEALMELAAGLPAIAPKLDDGALIDILLATKVA